MNAENNQGTTYYVVSESQLRQIAEDGAKSVLQQFGIDTDGVREKLLQNDKDEDRPVAYWISKLNVNRTTIWHWQKDGLITPKYVGKKLFFRQRDFDEMFAQRKEAAK